MLLRSVLVLLLLLGAGVGTAAAQSRNVLFISSYHPAFHSFFDQIQGLNQALKGDAGADVTLNIEFMDTKRLPGDENIASFRTRLAEKMTRLPLPDVVVVGDDNAFDFALAEQDGLFQGLPIVFLGVNNAQRALAQNDNPQITGVIEAPSIDATVQLARGLLEPDGRVYAIFDATLTGRLNRDIFETSPTVLDLGDRVEVLSLETQTFDDLFQTLRTIKPGSAIVLITAYRDAEGSILSSAAAAEAISNNASVPFLHPWQSTLGHGSLGGVVVSHVEQGYAAGGIVAEILSGGDPGDIPVTQDSPNVLILDWEVMNLFALSPGDFPDDARFLNRPRNIYQDFGSWIWAVVAFILVQSATIVVLIAARRRKRVAEQALIDSEARFRDFASVSSDWFWEMDRNLRFSFFSDRFSMVTGISQEHLLGKTREETGIPNLDRDSWRRHLETLHSHQPFRDFVHPRQKNGETVWLSINGRPIFDNKGEFLGYRGTGRDISEQIRSDEQRSIALTQAEAANQAKTEFLATMSHEFRTPLNAILGFSDMLKGQFFGPLGSDKYSDYASDIHTSGAHLMALVNDILDISAIEAGKLEVKATPIPVPEIVCECLRNMESVARQNGITLSAEIDETMPKLMADRRMLVQIVLNLLSNAIKFTPEGGGVTIAAWADQEAVVIRISDTGCGIPENRLSQIMEPFTRLHTNPLVSQQGGSGLGLAIVDALVGAHDGTLQIESTVGSGTTVSVRLPLVEEGAGGRGSHNTAPPGPV